MRTRLPVKPALPLCLGLTLATSGLVHAGCGGSSDTAGASGLDVASRDGGTGGVDATYRVGGTVTGLTGTGLVLANGSDEVAIAAPAGGGATRFAFPQKLPDNASFAVHVQHQPTGPAQVCSVSGGTGTVAAGDVTTVAVSCSRSFTLGGTVTGLAGTGLVLKSASTGTTTTVTVNANGAFAFPAPLEDGSTYAVTVETQPSGPSQTCAVANGSGTVRGDIANVIVTCTTDKHTIGGTLTGLAGTGLVLQNDGGDDLAVPANATTFRFSTALDSGQPYAVTVRTSPTAPNQECSVTKDKGTVASTDVSDVTVTCATRYYVDVATGSNTNAGSKRAPWKTVTYALANVPSGPVEIKVAPGTYDATAGETFPIKLKTGVTLTGDVANLGVGTDLTGTGTYAMSAGGNLSAYSAMSCGLVIPADVTNATVQGFRITSPQETVVVDKAAATFASNTVTGSTDVAFIVANGSQLDIAGSSIAKGTWGLLVTDATTKLTMRGTRVADANQHAVVLGYSQAFSGGNIDLGTAASPGGNTLLGSATGVGLWLQQSASGAVVHAAGNTWKPNVQGANGAGKYAASLVDGSVAVPVTSGNNYAIAAPSANAGIQF